MKQQSNPFDVLPELPADLYEPSGKLAFARTRPVITNIPDPVVVRPPSTPLPLVKRSSHEVKTFHAWVLYPHVVCYPMPDLSVATEMALERRKSAPRDLAGPLDLAAVADTTHMYKLSQFGGRPLETAWGCEVRYGPWFGTITYTQSCYDSLPDRWGLSSSVLSMQVDWEGGPYDMPYVPNLTVIWDPGQPAHVDNPCCDGFRKCSDGSCRANSLPCPDNYPV